MAIVIRLEFPWGRYHATQWGRNENEGHPEWPPSPWRVLRALFATWKTRCPHLPAEDIETALRQLAGSPALHTPVMRPAHLRHYMPQRDHRSIGKPSTMLTFDPFAVIDPQLPVFMEWNVDMPSGPAAALVEIASALSYLGRSESICNAALVDRAECPGLVSWQPAGDLSDTEILCARKPLELGNLIQTPGETRKGRRLIPTGSHLVPYKKADPARVEATSVRAKTGPARSTTTTTSWLPEYTGVRLAVHPRPRPTISDAVVVGDLLRQAAIDKHDAPSEALSGKIPSGERSSHKHQHAHYLSLIRGSQPDPSKPVDSLVVWAPGRIDSHELTALARVKWLRAGRAASRVPNLAIAVSAFGDIKDVAPELVGPSSSWQSFTPFAPGRHNRKLPWNEHIRIEIERELTVYRDLPVPASVEVLHADTRRYRRYRLPPKETMSDNRRASMVQIQFAKPVEGPIALGALSHFGLGLFLPYGLSAG
ncbi:MAG: type I-U CRISPR-associated protein Csb2 [Acidimicrobiaceae bacterium]|nr:type I-U CRISPR-associated protein Csb2 [Acidimicrobiaceae bacterium]